MTALCLCVPLVAFAHSGGTDVNGGHYDSSSGAYHYHHGYSAHLHPDGICPYAYDGRTGIDSHPSAGSSSGSSAPPEAQRDAVSSIEPEHRSSRWWVLPAVSFPLVVVFSLWFCSGKRKSKPAADLPPVSPSAAAPAVLPVQKQPHKLVVSDAVTFSFDGRSVPLYKIHAIFLLRIGYLRDTETLFILFFDDPAVHAFFHVPFSFCNELVRSDRPDLYFFDHIDGNFEYAIIPFLL